LCLENVGDDSLSHKQSTSDGEKDNEVKLRANKATDSASEDKDSILQYPTCKLKSQALAGEFLFLAWLFQRLLTNNEPTCSVIGTTFMSNIWALSESKTLLRCKRPSLLSRHLPQAQHQFSLFSDLSANILEIE